MKKAHWLVLLAIFLGVGILFLVPKDVVETWKLKSLESVSPFFKGIAWVKWQVTSFSNDLKSINQIKKENLGLVALNAQLRAENETFRNLEKENQELKRALKFQQTSSFRLLISRVIAREPSTWWQYVTIDRGEADGIKVDQAVVSPQGLIGKVAMVTQGTAKVVLLGDENCRVSSTLEGSNEQGIVVGQPTAVGTVQCRMTFIARTAAIEIGQRVYTSGLGGIFPQGLLIGEVAELVSATETGGFGLYREVLINPSAELSNLGDVFVVVGEK